MSIESFGMFSSKKFVCKVRKVKRFFLNRQGGNFQQNRRFDKTDNNIRHTSKKKNRSYSTSTTYLKVSEILSVFNVRSVVLFFVLFLSKREVSFFEMKKKQINI
jgi:hypothetical protein